MKILYVDIRTEPDKMDRQTFFLHWWGQDYRGQWQWRGQIFHAKLAPYLRGYNVVYGKPELF